MAAQITCCSVEKTVAQNDVLLLDSLVERSKDRFGQGRPSGELFELFCFDQILKDYDLSYEEIESGWIDGGDDGGIDGLFLFLDELPLTELPDPGTVRRNPCLDLFVLTVKHYPSFQQPPLNNLITSLAELFNLQKSTSELLHPFRDEILRTRELFRQCYIKLAANYPLLRIHVVYACRGQADRVPPNISSRAKQLGEHLAILFSNAEIRVDLMGASELLSLSRKQKSYSLRLKFIENNISRQSTNYVVLTLLKDYFAFITDENGRLRRYLFESNVRDYLGAVQVNRDISQTLALVPSEDAVDFWWLNNGVTLIASKAFIAGKEIILDNVQIVNGLQTTETIYRHFAERSDANDNRAILVKIVTTDNEEVRDRIIKATNYQNQVELASLRATEKIQRDIEHYLEDHGWFYDRRKNYHKNQDRSADRIVSMSYVGKAVRAIALRDPVKARKQKTKYMRNDKEYRQIFNDQWSLAVFLACVEIAKTTDVILRRWRRGKKIMSRSDARRWGLHVSLLHACRKLATKTFRPEDLASIEHPAPSENEVHTLIAFIVESRELWRSEMSETGQTQRRFKKSRPFTEFLLSRFRC